MGEAGLNAECGQRQREDQRRVEAAAAGGRLAQRMQHRNKQEQQPEGRQEPLTDSKVARHIALHRPQAAHAEGEDKCDPVQFAPGPKPRNAEHAKVEQQVKGEQHLDASGAGRDQQGRGEPSQRTQRGQRPCVLQHRQRARQDRKHRHESEGRASGKHSVQAQRRERRQVQDADRAALHRHRKSGSPATQAPADREEDERGDGHSEQAHLDRNMGVLRHIAQQECDADEQDQQSDPCDRVAAKKPVAHTGGPLRDGWRVGRNGSPGRQRRGRGRARLRHRWRD